MNDLMLADQIVHEVADAEYHEDVEINDEMEDALEDVTFQEDQED